jgi:hypothetical protein
MVAPRFHDHPSSISYRTAVKKFQVRLHGRNFLLDLDGNASSHGFFTTRWVEAENAEAAELAAVARSLRSSGPFAILGTIRR